MAESPVDVSVIVPTFNRLWSLPEAIASCRGSAARVEIIVVDDGSTDGTWEWLQSRPDLRALRQANRGKDWAVTAGFACARGRFVKFLDSDDWIIPGAIDRQLALAEAEAADVVVSGYEVADERGNFLYAQPWTHCDDFIAQQLGECDSSHYSAYLFRREFIADVPHRQEYGVVDDRMFVLEMALKSPRVSVSPEPAIRLRQHRQERLQLPQGVATVAKHHSYLQMYRRILAELEQRGDLTSRRARVAAKMLWPVAHQLAYTHVAEGARVARWVRELDPDFRIPDRGLLGVMYARLGFVPTERILRVRRAVARVARRPAAVT